MLLIKTVSCTIEATCCCAVSCRVVLCVSRWIVQSVSCELVASPPRMPRVVAVDPPPPHTHAHKHTPWYSQMTPSSSRACQDMAIKNARNRSRKWVAERMDMLGKSVSKPLGDIVRRYKHQLPILHPFEATLADLTVRAREKTGERTLQVGALCLRRRSVGVHESGYRCHSPRAKILRRGGGGCGCHDLARSQRGRVLLVLGGHEGLGSNCRRGEQVALVCVAP